MLSIAIAIEPPVESNAVRAVSESCEEAIGRGRCPPGSELRPAATVTWYALVKTEDTSAPELKIEFHDRAPSGTLIETRVLSFSARGNASSRWASVGAVIAAFVAARDDAAATPREPRVRVLPPVVSPPPPRESLAWDADLGMLIGPGLDHGSYRLGALGRGYVGVPGAPGVLGLVSLRYAQRPGDLALSWWSVSCGMGARWAGRVSPVSAELSFELAYERLQMSVVDPLTSATNDAAQNRFGGRLSMNLALRLISHLAWVAGVEATAFRPSVTITVADDERGRAPAMGYAFSTGVRFSGGG